MYEHLPVEQRHAYQTYRTLKDIYKQLDIGGQLVCPRGMPVKEIEDFSHTFAPYVRFVAFKRRGLNLSYIKREFLWYLRGRRDDLSICDHASIWKSCVNSKGEINSNYGHYIFGEARKGFNWVTDELIRDPDSRRASMPILGSEPEHLVSDVKDFPCTYALNFRIRDNRLNMSVHMRSGDAIYGLGSDLPIFSFIHEMVCVYLRDTYAKLELGSYHHAVDSFHVYERHFAMLKDILNEPFEDFAMPECPRINDKAEVESLLHLDYTNLDGNPVGPEGSFLRWVTTL